MRLADRLRGAFLRWSQVGLAGLLALPFLAASLLGFLWLFERGWLLWFALGSALMFGVVRGGRLLLSLRRRRQAVGDADAPPEGAPARQVQASPIDPDWTEAERAVYARARARINERLRTPLAWNALPEEALAVVEGVAADLSDGKRSALDFTLPEALLLIDRVMLRYRDFLRRHVPFSDQLSVRTLYWLWQRQDKAVLAWETGFLAWRGIRLVVNPAVGLMREAERAITAGLQDRLTDQFRRDAQAILLEEAAQAAVDLFSGRLRFSEAELMAVDLASEQRDRTQMAIPDDPLRIVLVGQISAGKSTLVNALVDQATAETDMAATTDRPAAHEIEIGDTACRLIDTKGLDDTEATLSALTAEMTDADMVLWLLRSNRPGRAPDMALLERFEAYFAAQPMRRAPPVIVVASVIDALLPGWPWPENRLPSDVRDRLGRAMAAIGNDMGGRAVIPVRAEHPGWNLDALMHAMHAALDEAAMVQRNRRRLQDDGGGWRLRENLGRARRGLGKGVGLVAGGLFRRSGGS
ncbi:MAG: 50S ribosome-binding GTPase [Pararhodobacter sp.]|nr:50S ribosome-binding GTPase [Pararhodobacter sp.]